MTSPAAALLTLPEVEQLETATRADLVYAIEGLAQLRDGNAHLVRGFATWHAYVLDVFGDLLAKLRLPRAERLALAASMDDAGLTVRQIADRLGVSVGTAQNYRAALGKVVPIGPRRSAAPTGRVYQQAAEWLHRHPEGLTRLELASKAGWSEGKAGGALADTIRVGLGARADVWRDGQRVFVLAEHSSARIAG